MLEQQRAQPMSSLVLPNVLMCLSNTVDPPRETEMGGVSWIEQEHEVYGSVHPYETDHPGHARAAGASLVRACREEMLQVGASVYWRAQDAPGSYCALWLQILP